MRILVVDDEVHILDIVSTFLTARGYEVVTASMGNKAVEMVKADPGIRAVLLDLVMPERNGMDTLKELMLVDAHPQVIMMTARADDTILEAVRLGAVDYVLKPIDFEALIARLAAFQRPGNS